MNCPKCGNPIAPNMKFCAKCGTAVAQVQPQQNTPPMQARPTAPKEMPNVPPMQSFPVNNIQPAPDKKKNKPKKKKNIGLIITAIVLAVAVLLTGGIFIFDSVSYKKSLEGAEYIEDFPVLKQKTELTVIDSEKFPVEEYNIKVEKMKMGGVLKSGKILKNETVVDDDATTPTYNIDFKEDGNYVITLTEIVASRTQPTETTEPSTQEESKENKKDKDDKKDKEEPIVIIIEVKVDDDDENAAERVDLNKNTGDKVPTASTEPSKDTSDDKQENKEENTLIQATESDFKALAEQINAPETISPYLDPENVLEFDCTKNSAEWVMDNLIFNCHFGGYTYFFSDTELQNEQDPLGKYWNENFKVPEDDIKWICENIYNVKYEPLAENVEFSDWSGYYSGGYYYYPNPVYGDGVYSECEVADYDIVNNKYEVIVNGYTCYDVERRLDRACKVTAEIKIIDGERYWSIYKIEKCDPCIKSIRVGESVEFGEYEIYDPSNGKEAISWDVLDIQGNKALVISSIVLDAKPYNEERTEGVTWETCTLRNWLNNDFYNTAFSSNEKNSVLTTKVITEDNTEFGTDGGNDTQDKVFLLSISEAEKYFGSDEERECKPSQYATDQGAYSYDGDTFGGYYDNCNWWLRSPGGGQYGQSCVNYDGSINNNDNAVDSSDDGVRPAMWITLG